MRRIIQSALPLLFALALCACASPAPDAAVAAPPMSDPLPATPLPAPPARAGSAGVPELDRSCRVDADCEVKNVGSCCGYHPACVNKDARPDPEAVQAACAASGLAGVCGFRDIQACACVSSTCQPAASGGALIR